MLKSCDRCKWFYEEKSTQPDGLPSYIRECGANECFKWEEDPKTWYCSNFNSKFNPIADIFKYLSDAIKKRVGRKNHV